MLNVIRCILFPIAFLAATFYSAYEIFWWVMVMERSPWTRGLSTPIGDAAKLLRGEFTRSKGM